MDMLDLDCPEIYNQIVMKNTEKKDTKKKTPETKNQQLDETWAEDAVQEILDYWEEHGVYIRE